MFSIGRFSRIAGLTTKALRHYHAVGLFTPAWVDPSTGYRWYSAAQLPALRRILALRDLGVPLAEIASLVAGGADLAEVLTRRRDDLERARTAAERALAVLDIAVAADGPDVVVLAVPPERVASLRRSVPPSTDLGPIFDEVEEVVRDADARAHRPPGSITHGRHTDGYADVEVWVPVTRTVASGGVSTRRLEAARMATTLHRGDYDTVDDTRRSLLAWIARSGMSVVGPERVVYLQFGADPDLEVPESFLVARAGDFLTEIQVPVG